MDELNERLIRAASKADISSVKECLRKGASVNYKGSSGNTTLHRAVVTKNTELTDLLIREGADLNLPNGLQKTPHDIADGSTKELLEQQTQLYYAVLRGDTDVVSLLIKKGANLNLQDTRDRTLLYIAVLYGYKEVIDALVKEGADLNLQNEEVNILCCFGFESFILTFVSQVLQLYILCPACIYRANVVIFM